MLFRSGVAAFTFGQGLAACDELRRRLADLDNQGFDDQESTSWVSTMENRGMIAYDALVEPRVPPPVRVTVLQNPGKRVARKHVVYGNNVDLGSRRIL